MGASPPGLGVRHRTLTIDQRPYPHTGSQTGELVYTPVEIQAEFIRHYVALYTSKASPGGDSSAEFLARVKLPHLENDRIETLEAPLDLEEIKSSIRELTSS
ncbi:hypothetical protein NDU88_004575 [Pleurodeles waltl]|uniref:Uncharacterized protein n=1 Tax=Pleurodeles waltl TaxID=8319 RepID=A0AAV7SJB2_PLEWA|nr:hypothetical protein NDU88_004575 [Pleurodeles waltl]